MLVRPFEERDYAALPPWFANEAALVQWGGWDMRFPLDRAQLEVMAREGTGHPPARWLFTGEDDGVVAAHAQVALNWRHGTARLGRFGLAPDRRGRGLAAPFLREIVGRVFAEPDFERLELNVFTRNEPAIRTYRRLGFLEEGVRRSSVRVGDARWDTAIYGLLRREWEGRR